MSVKIESIIKGIETAIRIMAPALKQLMSEREWLKAKVAAGEEITDEEWAARDAEWEDTLAELETLLGPAQEPTE